jgi:hypothetical protein
VILFSYPRLNSFPRKGDVYVASRNIESSEPCNALELLLEAADVFPLNYSYSVQLDRKDKIHVARYEGAPLYSRTERSHL